MNTRRVESLDLLRGIAITGVMARHALPAVFPGAGVVGVVMFFTLSGYLISGVLFAELRRTSTLRLRTFYARRARRLVPALLVVLCAITLVTVLASSPEERSALPATWLVALTWTANLPGRPETTETSFHLWTLAGEEQFYLVLPALLLLAWRRGRVGVAIAVAAVASALACAATLWWLWEVPDNAYVLPTSWAGCFVIGVAARWCEERLPRPPAWLVASALVALAVLAVSEVRGHVWTYAVVGPAVALLTALLLLAWREWRVVRPQPLRALAWLGTVSYGAYLWNYPLSLWLRPHGAWGAVLAVVLTVVIAAASWRFVERPLLGARTQDASDDGRDHEPHGRTSRERLPSW